MGGMGMFTYVLYVHLGIGRPVRNQHSHAGFLGFACGYNPIVSNHAITLLAQSSAEGRLLRPLIIEVSPECSMEARGAQDSQRKRNRAYFYRWCDRCTEWNVAIGAGHGFWRCDVYDSCDSDSP